MLALAILVGGVLYLSSFRAGLIDQKIESLTTEARLVGITIAEAAGEHDGPGYDRIMANEVLRRMSLPNGLRAQIYDRGGRLTGDSRSLFPNQIPVEISPIDDKREAARRAGAHRGPLRPRPRAFEPAPADLSGDAARRHLASDAGGL